MYYTYYYCIVYCIVYCIFLCNQTKITLYYVLYYVLYVLCFILYFVLINPAPSTLLGPWTYIQREGRTVQTVTHKLLLYQGSRVQPRGYKNGTPVLCITPWYNQLRAV